ncbi:hypothetical protein DM02DRAFT_151381 [Periconia macrospinosa]|uniref:Uncharacterized protein n=1 Tax=Periconia macrospinosa TaxID=97972 RepID=A0A2V1EFJ7_9PLEO|nr:hypothetical protein DM02DRAFT_151381 [Periconia macrospinosa]
MATLAPPRKFNVEPIETIIRSSKDRVYNKQEDVQLTQETASKPIDIKPKVGRRFVPQLIETTTKSSKQAQAETASVKRPRKFVPEPIETSTRSSRKKFADEWESQTTNAEKKERPPRKPRKFAPQLVETAQRSRRAGDPARALQPTDKTEATPVTKLGLKTMGLAVPGPPTNTPTFDYSHNPLFEEIQRATSPITRRRLIKRQSQHCFRVPDLDAIESSESEGSTPSSPLCTPYFATHCHSYREYKEPTRIRESADERSSGYLLALAAKAAEKQLRDQAMAAFPNDEHHEHVDHFVDREDSLLDSMESRSVSSHKQVNWDVLAMRAHHEKIEKLQDGDAEVRGRRRECPEQKNGEEPDSTHKNILGGCKKDDELDCMRKGARPPMLGKDIKFPRCSSPEPARFDTTQGCDVVKKAMSYLSEQSQQAEKGGESLWCGRGNGKQTSQVLSLWGGSNASSRSQSRQSGLWGGCCASSCTDVSKGPTGLLTPRKDKEEPPSPCPTPSALILPPTPPASQADFAGIDERLTVEANIEQEFGDNFVTQVYNYLSLGYPSMARPFDEELSKISKTSIEELRQDDHLAQSRGYIRLGADGNLTDEEITEESCMRWRALRIYIREWAKQKPGMAGESPAGGMGTAVRRGSWGI